MNVKEYLNQAYSLHQEIQHKKAHLATLRELETDTSSNLSDMPKAALPDPQRIEGVLAKVVDLEREIAEDEKQIVASKAAVADLIAQVPDTQQLKILAARYIEFLDWSEIASKMAIGKSWVRKRHKQAVELLEKLFSQSS